MVIDPRMLRRALPPEPISRPTPCRFCGYDLVGLMNDGKCPECGNPIRAKAAGRFDEEQMTDAPVGYLRVLSMGALMLLAGWVTMGLALIVLGFAPGMVWAGIFTGGALAWWGGVMVVSRPRASTAKSGESRAAEWFALRMVSRVTQALWVLCGGVTVVLLGMPGGGPAWLMAVAIGVGIAASAGMIPTSLLIANYGYWASDTSLALKLRAMTFLVAFLPAVMYFGSNLIIPFAAGLLRGVGGEARGAPIVGFLLIGGVILMIPSMVYTWCLWTFWADTSWSVANHIASDEKEERFRHRSEEEAQRARLADVGVNPATLPGFRLAEGSEVPPPASRSLSPGNRAKGMAKKKSADPNPYDLSEE